VRLPTTGVRLCIAVLVLALLVSACDERFERRLPYQLGSSSTETTVHTVNLELLEVAGPDPSAPDYNRKDWKHWSVFQCRSTRDRVLIEEALGQVTFKSQKNCKVKDSIWYDPFTGATVNKASQLDVDHMVPLANAHRSGGWAWDSEKKEAYANDMSTEEHLISVSSSANRQKSDKGPDAWRPKNLGYHCQYAEDWISVKKTWDLTITSLEKTALQEMLSMC
jgi:hypothetical protein